MMRLNPLNHYRFDIDHQPIRLLAHLATYSITSKREHLLNFGLLIPTNFICCAYEDKCLIEKDFLASYD